MVCVIDDTQHLIIINLCGSMAPYRYTCLMQYGGRSSICQARQQTNTASKLQQQPNKQTNKQPAEGVCSFGELLLVLGVAKHR